MATNPFDTTPLTQTPEQEVFPYRAVATSEEITPTRFATIPTPDDMRARSLFGIPLKSFLTGQTIEDPALQFYIDASISELEHLLDIYITPVQFLERHDYDREKSFWSFGYVKVDHSPILHVDKFRLTFNNGSPGGMALVDIPLEFIHTQPQEGTIQLVPAQGVSISGLIVSIYSGLGYHAFNSQAISYWPGALEITYTAGFQDNKIPVMIAALIENMAALKFLSIMGPILFPHNSVSIGIDGTSQSVGTLGPNFLVQRIKELQDLVDREIDIAKGYYQKRFLIDAL